MELAAKLQELKLNHKIAMAITWIGNTVNNKTRNYYKIVRPNE